MDLSIVIPAYNEQEIIEKSIEETLRFFSPQPFSWELIVVNDGSVDATGKILEALQGRDARVRVITFPKNRGKGAAVREGFLKSQGDYMLFFDADLSTPLSEFSKFWQQKNGAPRTNPQESTNDELGRTPRITPPQRGWCGGEHTVLIGSRARAQSNVVRHQVKIKEMAGKFGNFLTRLMLPLPYHDTQCGFKLYPGSFRNLLPFSTMHGAAFDIEWLLIAQQNGFTIQEIPITWTNRPSSRFGARSYILTLKQLLALTWRFRRKRYHILHDGQA